MIATAFYFGVMYSYLTLQCYFDFNLSYSILDDLYYFVLLVFKDYLCVSFDITVSL